MTGREYSRQPDEFNRFRNGNRIPAAEEKKEKKKRLKFYKRILVTFSIILPITISIGWLPFNAFNFGPGTYQSRNTILHLDETTGWFFDGTSFLPLKYSQQDLTYDCSGGYPDPTDSRSIYMIESHGPFKVNGAGFTLLNPFSQKKERFTLSQSAADATYIDQFQAAGFSLNGKWTGRQFPNTSYHTAYVSDLTFSSGKVTIRIANTYNTLTQKVEASWRLDGNVLTIIPSSSGSYILELSDRTYSFNYGQPLTALISITEKGLSIKMNMFTQQSFTR